MLSLYTQNTPNGLKVNILLEELGLAYTQQKLSFSANEQKQPWFLDINPNGRIPAIVDHTNNDLAVFESGAILWYLAERARRFIPLGGDEKIQALQWLMFQMSGIGPMKGQAHHFILYAPVDIAYGKTRYRDETKRLYGVLETQLQRKPYINGEYSIVDMATWPWINGSERIGIDLNEWPKLAAWVNTIAQRPAVIRAQARLAAD